MLNSTTERGKNALKMGSMNIHCSHVCQSCCLGCCCCHPVVKNSNKKKKKRKSIKRKRKDTQQQLLPEHPIFFWLCCFVLFFSGGCYYLRLSAVRPSVSVYACLSVCYARIKWALQHRRPVSLFLYMK